MIDPYLNRTDFDYSTKLLLEKIISDRKKLPSVTAIYRVKNGAAHIELSILSIAAICTEIIVVDNLSHDSTKEIIKKLQSKLVNICKIKLFSYEMAVPVAGKGYKQRLKESETSLAKYYEFCFSLGTGDYLMKVDSHAIFFPKGLLKIQKKLLNNPNFIMYRGIEVFGKKLSYEPFIFKNDNNYKFIDDEEYERLIFSYRINVMDKILNSIFEPTYVHVKRLSYIMYSLKKNMAESLYS